MFALGQLVGFWAGGVSVPPATVDWNFAVSQSLVDASSLYTLSHTRNAVGATHFDSSGDVVTVAANVARFGYHPVTLASLGLLIESDSNWEENYNEQVTNAANWTSNEITATLNAATFIDGTTVADKIIPTTASSTHWITGSGKNGASATEHSTHGMYAKANGYNYMMMECTAGTAVFKMWVDLTDGSIGDTSGTATSFGVEPLQDDWYFVWAHIIGVSTNDRDTKTYVSSGTTSGDETFSGNASNGVLFCGAHLHAQGKRGIGHYRGPTTTGDVQQLDDDVDISTTGWFNASEGTMSVDYFQFGSMSQWQFYGMTIVDASDVENEFLSLHDTPAADQYRSTVKAGGVTVNQFLETGPTEGVGGYHKLALAYKLNDYQMGINGVATAVDSSGAVPANLDRLKIGRAWNDIQRDGAYVQRVRYWNTRLSQAQLEAITSV